MKTEDYECALTGVTANGPYHESDGLEDLPVGWTKIQITRRGYNPKWLAIQQVKQEVVDGLLAQFPQEAPDEHRFAVALQIEAQFHGLESATPVFLADVEDTVYISDEVEVIEHINELRELLGLELLVSEEEVEAEEDGDEGHLPHDGESGDK